MRARIPIFLGLVLIALAWTLCGQQNIPPVFLNHLQMVLPSPVYAEIRQSPFLKNEFSALEEHTNTAGGTRSAPTPTPESICLAGIHTWSASRPEP